MIAASIKHVNGTATVTPDTLIIGVGAISFLVDNRGSNDLLVSFDKGNEFKTIGAGLVLSFDVVVSQLTIKSSAGSVNYEILVGIL
ncbi:hypothetical protein LCGC14_1798820 [marine sediment metagenome]|uniref:Uncharacterized protein n=1 Tax=marine sediment metagenome TaxID=412755 RepID=A0A0F9GQC8_9ZZZZ